MQKIELNDFKAHQNLIIDLTSQKKNLLLFGENGAGKSSLFDALKLTFFYQRLINTLPEKNTREETLQEEVQYLSEFNNTITQNSFEIKINDTNYKDFLSSNHNIFMLNFNDTYVSKYIYLNTLIDNAFFSSFDYSTNIDEIKDEANNILSFCKETVKIEIDTMDNNAIKLTDTNRNINTIKNVKEYFNEGKLNLVILSIFLAYIKTFFDNGKKNLLILDDFITSLDMSNRNLLMKYIYNNFLNDNFQIFLFTHNVYFYNLNIYLLNDIYQYEKCLYINLYEIEGKHLKYENLTKKKLELNELENNFKDSIITPEDAGNKIRQKFEILLYELSKILLVGGVEDSSNILNRILSDKFVCINPYDLIFEITKEINGLKRYINCLEQSGKPDKESKKLITYEQKIGSLENKITNAKLTELINIKKILLDLKLYRKVSMHPLSHGQIGQSSFSTNEIQDSINLLKMLETNIFSLIGTRVESL